MKDRIENIQMRDRIAGPKEAASIIKSGMVVAMGGYTACGCPKKIPLELIKRREEDPSFSINVIASSTLGYEIDDLLAQTGAITLRTPITESRVSSAKANTGEMLYIEQQMAKMPRLLKNGALGKIDVLVMEALSITKEGAIIPTTSVGFVPLLAELAENIIVEINTAQPEELFGIHDIFMPGFPPNSLPIPLTRVNQRIGDTCIQVDPKKIKYIVQSDILDHTSPAAPAGNKNKRITDNLLNFLELETKKMGYLPPVQTGIGNLAKSIINAFGESNFKEIEFYCGALHEANIELIITGKVKAESAGSLQLTPRVLELLKSMPQALKEFVVLRNGEISNSLEVVNRLGVIALNSAIEIDIYGNANSSHIMGNKVVNGIGGGANFAQSSGLSIMLVPADNKEGKISTIVPMVTHCDINEHDIDVIITDIGVADLRGKGEVQRAESIINNCASPVYKDLLNGYLMKAVSQSGGHHPVLLKEAFALHERLKETGSMI